MITPPGGCPAGLGKGLEGKAFEDIVNTDELVDEDDLAAAFSASTWKAHGSRGSKGSGSGSGSGGKQRSATPEKQQAVDLLRSDSMSARERNKLKRKYKALTKQDSLKADGKGRVSGTRQTHAAFWWLQTASAAVKLCNQPPAIFTGSCKCSLICPVVAPHT